jgi:hypothetical protein
MSSESEQVIERLTAQFRGLLTDNWVELWAYRNGDRHAKASVSFDIGPEGRQYVLGSTLSYGIRLKHSVQEIFSPTQLSLNFDGNGARATSQKKAAL